MKKIKYLILFIFIIGINKVHAFNISTPYTTVYEGSKVAVTVDISDLTGRFTISSSNQAVLAGGESNWYENQVVTIYFDARSVGQSTITVYSNNPSNKNGENQGEVSRVLTINVVAQPTYNPIDVNPTYSSNNYLIELSIDGATITPDFDKETLEYSVELDSSVEKINIKAKTENSKASVVGTGEVEVNEGNNEIKLTVRAENGNERVYIINALVKEINPIEVEVNDKKYHIVKKESLLGEVEGFKKEMIEIYNEEIPALYNETTKYTLVALRDEKGNTSLFVYDKKDNSFTKYNEINVNGLRINVLDIDNDEYTKDEIKIDDKKIVVYKKDKYKYYLIYGTNIETGKTSWYSYDEDENTLQRYIKSKSNETKSSNNKTIIYLGVLLLILSFFFTILSIKYKKGVSK